MNNKLILIAATIFVFSAFFMPWVNVESAAIGGISKILTGKGQSTIDNISGFDVPIMANSEESRLMISIVKIFQPGITDVDKKSYLIWLVPLLGVGFFLLNYYFGKNKWVLLGIGIIGVAIFVGGTFKITTTDLDKLVLKVNMMYGVWVLLIGYLTIGLCNLFAFYQLIKKPQS